MKEMQDIPEPSCFLFLSIKKYEKIVQAMIKLYIIRDFCLYKM